MFRLQERIVGRTPSSLTSLAQITAVVAPQSLFPTGHFLATHMRNFLVPQTVHWPVTARRTFFGTTSPASRLSVLLGHLEQ